MEKGSLLDDRFPWLRIFPMNCSPVKTMQAIPLRLKALKFSAKYFLDTEFQQRSSAHADFISIGITSDDGRDFYAISKEFAPASADRWIRQNVLKNLDPENGPKIERKPLVEIREEIVRYIGNDQNPEFYIKDGKQDWTQLCNLFGGENKFPANFPRLYHDVRELCKKIPKDILDARKDAHNALADAKWLKGLHDWLLANGINVEEESIKAPKPETPPDKQGTPKKLKFMTPDTGTQPVKPKTINGKVRPGCVPPGTRRSSFA
ncbi:MAG TPA: hypothetical protein V6C52_00780 [Coleofasciculaceae cyanobacterium]